MSEAWDASWLGSRRVKDTETAVARLKYVGLHQTLNAP